MSRYVVNEVANRDFFEIFPQFFVKVFAKVGWRILFKHTFWRGESILYQGNRKGKKLAVKYSPKFSVKQKTLVSGPCF